MWSPFCPHSLLVQCEWCSPAEPQLQTAAELPGNQVWRPGACKMRPGTVCADLRMPRESAVLLPTLCHPVNSLCLFFASSSPCDEKEVSSRKGGEALHRVWDFPKRDPVVSSGGNHWSPFESRNVRCKLHFPRFLLIPASAGIHPSAPVMKRKLLSHPCRSVSDFATSLRAGLAG